MKGGWQGVENQLLFINSNLETGEQKRRQEDFSTPPEKRGS